MLSLIRQSQKKQHLVSVICLERRGELAGAAEAAGAKVYCLDKPPGLMPGVTRKAFDLLGKIMPTVVHTHAIGALWYVGAAARRAGVGAVVHTQHINSPALARSLLRRIRAKMLWGLAGRYADRFICVSKETADSVKRFVATGKVLVVDNGIDIGVFDSDNRRQAIRRELGIAPEARVIGNVARLDEVKCHDLLIHAFAAVRKTHADCRLVLVGDGARRANLEELVSSLGLKPWVHFAGYRDNPQSYLQAMDIFALTSRIEGLPLAILEACAARLPVVATRVGGVAQVIAHEESGLLIESGDQKALEAAIGRLLDDPALSRRLGETARRRIDEHYSIARMADEYEHHYRAALADHCFREHDSRVRLG